ncbi:hypothetical protein ABOM_003054 [Aspergillus bombycis]|uniref:Uncharacterized protein n=1 Tax=Aspergillus bombycis TaxID=109264 RepID=A0A1F8AAM9_9EURO|nr:hypothetical protein ABOM_003054 [Aspergillus bombycis]OGM48780.1 hypothetical protein ABOM_003054 [Aspergillus bombycis]
MPRPQPVPIPIVPGADIAVPRTVVAVPAMSALHKQPPTTGSLALAPAVPPQERILLLDVHIPEIAIVGGGPYTVTGGGINVNGTSIRVPNVGGSEQVSTIIDNVPMVIIPSYSGTVVVPVFPAAKPTSDSNPDSTTSSTTTSTTSTTSSAEPAPTSADGCDLMRKQGVCWNKCDPITGKAVPFATIRQTVQPHSNVNQVVGLEVDVESQNQILAVAP